MTIAAWQTRVLTASEVLLETDVALTPVTIRRGDVVLVSDAGSDDGTGLRISGDSGFPDDFTVELIERAQLAGIRATWLLIEDASPYPILDAFDDDDYELVGAVFINAFPSRGDLKALIASIAPDHTLLITIANADDWWFETADEVFHRAINTATWPGYRDTRYNGSDTGDTNFFIVRELVGSPLLTTAELTA